MIEEHPTDDNDNEGERELKERGHLTTKGLNNIKMYSQMKWKRRDYGRFLYVGYCRCDRKTGVLTHMNEARDRVTMNFGMECHACSKSHVARVPEAFVGDLAILETCQSYKK